MIIKTKTCIYDNNNADNVYQLLLLIECPLPKKSYDLFMVNKYMCNIIHPFNNYLLIDLANVFEKFRGIYLRVYVVSDVFCIHFRP